MYSSFSDQHELSLVSHQNCVINGKQYHLNNSRTKFVNIGLDLYNDFVPCIELGSKSVGSVILSEEDWKYLLQHQGTITSYFFSNGYFDVPIRFNNLTIYFDKIDEYNVLKIKHDDNRYIYFGCESICKLWDLIPVIDYRIEMLKKQHFDKYYNTLKTNLMKQPGDLLTNVFNDVSPKQNPNNENINTMLELLTVHPNVLEFKLKQRKHYYEEIGNV